MRHVEGAGSGGLSLRCTHAAMYHDDRIENRTGCWRLYVLRSPLDGLEFSWMRFVLASLEFALHSIYTDSSQAVLSLLLDRVADR